MSDPRPLMWQAVWNSTEEELDAAIRETETMLALLCDLREFKRASLVPAGPS